jgi:FkbM family methyltransferase
MTNTDKGPHQLALKNLHNPINLWLHDHRDQHVSKCIAETGVWEAYETELLISRLQDATVFVDVGANIGYYTAIAADQFAGRGYIAAFEPDFDNFQLLNRNLKENNFSQVDAVNAALSDQQGEGHLFLNTSNFGDHQIYDDGSGRDCNPITLLNGADYLQDKISHIDLLKIDTQGAEFHVVSGLLPLLKASGEKLSMIIEFWPYGLRQAGANAHLLLDLLSSLDLPFAVIDHQGHKLLPCSEKQLIEWVDMVEVDLSDQGFMNILVGA